MYTHHHNMCMFLVKRWQFTVSIIFPSLGLSQEPVSIYMNYMYFYVKITSTDISFPDIFQLLVLILGIMISISWPGNSKYIFKMLHK